MVYDDLCLLNVVLCVVLLNVSCYLNMASIQERLQMKREPLDKWSVREQLCLVSAVNRSGDQNWMSVSRALKPFGEPNRPSDWFHQKNCAAQFGALLANIETPKRKKRASGQEIVIETPVEIILRKLLQERQAELKALLTEERAEYLKLQEDMVILQSGNVSEEQLDIWCREIDEEEQKKEEESNAHAHWLKEREQRKQDIERAWRPTKPQSLGHKRKNSDSIDSLFEGEHIEEQQNSHEQAKPALSPLLTSLLKSPSQVQNVATSSILHSAITNQRPSTNTNPMIASLLNSSANVSVSPSLQQLVSSAIGQEQETEVQAIASDILDDATLPNLKIDDLANSILVPDGPLPEIKNEEVDVIISDLIENAHDIVADPEQHLQLDGNGDININLELDDLEENEESDLPGTKDNTQVQKTAEKPTPAVDPFEFQEDPEIFQHTKISTSMKHQQFQQQMQQIQHQQQLQSQMESQMQQVQQEQLQREQLQQQQIERQAQQFQLQQKNEQQPMQDFQVQQHTFQQFQDQHNQSEQHQHGQYHQFQPQQNESTILPKNLSHSDPKEEVNLQNDEKPENEEKIEEEVVEKETDDQANQEKPNIPGSVEIVEVVVMEEEEIDKQLNRSEIEDIVHSVKNENKVEDMLKADIKETLNNQEVKQESCDEQNTTEKKEEPLEVKIEPGVNKESQNLAFKRVANDSISHTLPTIDFTEEFYDDINMEIKIDKSGKAKRDYSRTKKKEEKDFDLLVALEKSQLAESDLADLSFSDKEYQETENKYSKAKVKNDTERSSSPWTEEEDGANSNNRVRRRYSTPATPVDSIPNSPASSTTAYYDDDREYRNWKKSVMLVFSRLTTHKYASLFLKPITDDQAPGYHSIVYRPTDLQTIRKNIENGTIRTTQEFQRDVLLMFTNAIMYNKTNDTVYNMARQMQQESLQPIQILLEATSDDGPLRRETRTSEPGNKRKRGPEELIRNKKRKDDS